MVTQVLNTIELQPPGPIKPFIYSLCVHLAFILFISVSLRWSSDPDLASQRIIQAVVVSPADLPKPEKPKLEPEVKKKEIDKAALKKKQLAEKKRKAEALATQKKQEAVQQKLQAEKALKEMLVQEELEREQAAKAAKAASLVDQYKVAIRQKVSRNWVRPPGAPAGLRCVVKVRLVPSGDVLEAKVVRSSGSVIFDRSVENAVYKAAPLPIPKDTDLFDFFREIEFLFNPED